MKLHVLARGEVAFPPAKLVGDASQLAHLVRRQPPSRHLGAHHLDARLALPVDPSPQPVGAELIFGNLACEKGVGLGPEQFDIFPNRSIVFVFG